MGGERRGDRGAAFGIRVVAILLGLGWSFAAVALGGLAAFEGDDPAPSLWAGGLAAGAVLVLVGGVWCAERVGTGYWLSPPYSPHFHRRRWMSRRPRRR